MFHSMKDAMCMLLVYTNHIIVLTISNFVRNVFSPFNFPSTGTELRPSADGLLIRVGRDQDVVHERTVRQESSVFQTKEQVRLRQKIGILGRKAI